MNISNTALILFAISAIGLRAQTPAAAVGSQTAVPPPTDYRVVQQDANSQVWQRENYEESPSGEVITNVESYTELATGLNYLDTNGQWQSSKEEIDIQPDGTASATQGQHQAFFPVDILNGEIELVTPDHKDLKSQPVALSYDDGSNTVLIAVLTNSIGQIINDNQVIYTNAFAGLNADLLYTYSKAGFEQDVVLREQPPDPQSLSLNAATTRLQVLTEFFNPPQPGETTGTLPEQAGVILTDDTLDFGLMQMVQGKAFLLGENTPAVNVGKSWLATDGRQFLVEAVPVEAMADELDNLPPAPTTQAAATTKLRMISRNLILPPQHMATSPPHQLHLAKAEKKWKPGVVLDYITINSSHTNYTFRGDTTYYVSGLVYSYGTNTFEGGTVLKYATNGDISISPDPGTTPGIFSQGTAYHPIVFTSKDDNSVGDTISGATGSPSGYYGTMLAISGFSPASALDNFRMMYASTGISCSGVNASFYNAQFLKCQNVFNCGGATVGLRNALFANNATNFVLGGGSSLNAQNATFNGASCVAVGPSSPSGVTLSLTNCILSTESQLTNGALTLGGACNGFYSCQEFGSGVYSNTFYPFQSVGAGNFYLTNGCIFTNVGSAYIDPTLLAELSQMTTHPPLLYSNVVKSTNLVLGPYASRDTNAAPNLGYHYAPLDYLVDVLTMSNALTIATLILTNGVAVGYYNDVGIYLANGSAISSVGTPPYPNWLTSYQTVQEQPVSLSMNEYGPGQAYDVYPGYNTSAPYGKYSFTKFTCMAGGGYNLFHSGDFHSYGNLLVQDCEFWGGANYFAGFNGMTANVINNLFVRSTISAALTNSSTSSSTVSFTNNLVWGASSVIIQATSTTTENAFNNDFDSCTITTYSPNCTNGYNAYLNCTGRLNPTNSSDIFSASALAYQTSYLGTFYQPTNSPLLNMGSTNANLLGLYHFTTQTNQTVQGDAIVDIGYHYVATGTNGLPLDTNGDGIPDYLEDANGDGIFDAGDLGDWQISPYGLNSGNALQVFTPLK